MFRQAQSRLPTLLVGRCHSFRREGMRDSSTLASMRSTGRFAKESNSSKTAIAALVATASVVAVSHHNDSKTTTKMQGRFSFWSKQSPKNNNKLLSHPNITTWKKGGRKVYLLGARSYSTESADFATQLVETIRPQAVFVDIDEHVFVSYGMYDTCKNVLKEAGVSTNDLDFDFQGDVEGTLPAIPKNDSGSTASFFSFGSSNALETAIQQMFAKLKYAGLDEMQPMASSGEHFVNALTQGHKNGATLCLGGRNYDVTKERTDEAMAHTPASAAAVPLDLKWRPDETDRENYRRYRNEMKRVFPIFFQVVGTELDEHIATKLNKLDVYPNIVAVVMMLHVDGVEESLKSMGWKEEG